MANDKPSGKDKNPKASPPLPAWVTGGTGKGPGKGPPPKFGKGAQQAHKQRPISRKPKG